MMDFFTTQLGAVTDYDFITIAGKQYTAGQLLDKDLLVTKDVWLYHGLSNDTNRIQVKAGQSAGKVYTYLLPGGANKTGKVVLGIDHKDPATGQMWTYWLKDDNAVSQSALKAQGTLTVEEQVKQEQEEKEKSENPVEYYIKQYAWKVLLIGGGIYLVAQLGKEFVKGKLSNA